MTLIQPFLYNLEITSLPPKKNTPYCVTIYGWSNTLRINKKHTHLNVRSPTSAFVFSQTWHLWKKVCLDLLPNQSKMCPEVPTSQVLDHLLAWCYADTFRDLDLPSLMELFRAAECYEIQGLLTKCGQRISKIMTVTWHRRFPKMGENGWVGWEDPSMGIREMGMIWGVILGSWPRGWARMGFLLC